MCGAKNAYRRYQYEEYFEYSLVPVVASHLGPGFSHAEKVTAAVKSSERRRFSHDMACSTAGNLRVGCFTDRSRQAWLVTRADFVSRIGLYHNNRRGASKNMRASRKARLHRLGR